MTDVTEVTERVNETFEENDRSDENMIKTKVLIGDPYNK